jgi:hypothetical protein
VFEEGRFCFSWSFPGFQEARVKGAGEFEEGLFCSSLLPELNVEKAFIIC